MFRSTRFNVEVAIGREQRTKRSMQPQDAELAKIARGKRFVSTGERTKRFESAGREQSGSAI